MSLAELISPFMTLGCTAKLPRGGAARLITKVVQDACALLRTADLSCLQGMFIKLAKSSDFSISNIISSPMNYTNFGGRYPGNGGHTTAAADVA
nr:hypothetical protein CFP56_21588 [Quercus suber]